MSVPITRDGPYVAPFAYKLAAGESWQALTISATWDGTSASGAFYPCCSIYTQDGKLVSRDFPSSSVAAGASAEVTYHPFLRQASTAAPPSAQTAPTVATFYRRVSGGDPAQTIGAGATANLLWPNAALPSDGSITGPIIGSTFASINMDCMAVVYLRVGWEDGAYSKAAVIGTTARDVPADVVSSASYMAGASPLTQDTHDWVIDAQPNAFRNGDLLHAYVVNGDAVPRNVEQAWLVIHAWAATGYTGTIPGWPN